MKFEEVTGKPFNEFLTSAFEYFAEVGNKQLSEQELTLRLIKHIRTSDLIHLMYACLLAGYRKENKPVAFTLDDVIDWSDEANETLYEVFALTMEGAISNATNQIEQDTDAKKKILKKRTGTTK